MKYELIVVIFNEDYYQKEDEVETPTVFIEPNAILKFLGFNYKYTLKVLEEPVQKGDNFEYSVKIISSKLNWYGKDKLSSLWKRVRSYFLRYRVQRK